MMGKAKQSRRRGAAWLGLAAGMAAAGVVTPYLIRHRRAMADKLVDT